MTQPIDAGFDQKPPSRIQLLLQSPATLVITLINIVVFVLAEHSGSTLETETLIRFGASTRPHIWSGEYWRFVTPMFLHIGIIHLLWNTWAGFGWCSTVEQALGWRRFLPAYLLSGIGATAVSVIGHNVVSAGASGAGFGIVGVTLVLLYRTLGSLSALLRNGAARGQLASIGIWLLIGFTMLQMDNFAHLGGLFFGILFGLAFTPPSIGKDRPLLKAGLAVAGVVVVVLLAARPL